ncbi:MAG: FAD-binding and (Fe-S)-binding domain-containing protein [Actinomycetota bacterium]
MQAHTEPGRALADALRNEVEGSIHTDGVTRALYATDASNYKIVPDAVLVARSIRDLQAATESCKALGIPVTPRGAGTSLAGQAVGRGLHIDTFHLEGIEIVPEARAATVSCGTVQRHLDIAAAKRGLTFGPDTATANRATIGGMVGNNAAGPRSIVYGMTRDRLAWAEMVMDDGSRGIFGQTDGSIASGISGLREERKNELAAELEAIRDRARPLVAERYPQILRHVDGYGLDELCKDQPNLARFLAGSEGTLGVFSRLGVQLDRRPSERALGVLSFTKLEDALYSVPNFLERDPSAIELLDRGAMTAGHEDAAVLVDPEAEAYLFVEFQGTNGRAREALEALPEEGATRMVRLEDPREQRVAWRIRERALGAAMAFGEPGTVPSFVEDTAVAADRLAPYVRLIKSIVQRYDTRTLMWGHVSVGCLHMHPLFDLRTADGVSNMERMAREIVDVVRDFNGAISGEHGNGLSKSPWLERYFGLELLAEFGAVKRAFDPGGILNPGKIVDPEPMTANLRYGETYRVQAPESPLFTSPKEMAAEAELCFGAGACKKLSGTMCPPAMVTREERHTTRARANALRSVMTGDLPPESLTAPEMKEVMDLCIGCKACKSECPVGVDMARLKTDWLWRVRRAEGSPPRAKMVADLRRMSARASKYRWLTNPLSRTALARNWMVRRGFAGQRRPPRFSKPFSSGVQDTKEPTVVIFPDCFTEFQEPWIGTALSDLLHAAAEIVGAPDAGCCGRAMLSQGFVEAARDRAQRASRRLRKYADQGTRILFLEPSCLSMVTDDWPHMLPKDEAVAAVADASFPAEDYVVDFSSLWLEPSDERVLLHPHCHQKALWGTDSTEAALARVPGASVKVLDAGCCGMAGAFGYEAEHYEMSVAMGEGALAPAIRAAGDAAVVAPGTSCRTQIRDLTGREALHPIEYLAQHLRQRAR